MPTTILADCKEEWQDAWDSAFFRRKMIMGFILTITIMCIFPFFFQSIEKRNGYLLQDPILALLPPHNFSIAIFLVIWTITSLAIYRSAQTPSVFLNFMWCWILLSLMRMLTITLVPLNTPAGLVILKDPVSNFFYGKNFITKDLFFSGHTSTLFLLFFCMNGRTDKILALAATATVGFLLMAQHVHYSLDVLCAPFFAWIAYTITRKSILKDI